MMPIHRRDFIKQLSTLAVLAGASPWVPRLYGAESPKLPSYLAGYEHAWRDNPLAANTQWFRNAGLGLFMHYGLNAISETHTWYMYGKYYDQNGNVAQRAPVPIREFEQLADRFTCEDFDADFITDLALEAGCKYVNITTRHHDGFCLWDSASEPFNAKNAAGKRDLVGELSLACEKKGLALLPYWSIARDWRHPHAPPEGRPPYEKYFGKPDPRYAGKSEYNIEIYNEFVRKQITELFTQYKIAGIWFDGVGIGRPRQQDLHLQELYQWIHSQWPGALISYKNGVTGTEDFLACEGELSGADFFDPTFFKLVDRDVPREICSNLGKSWAWVKQFSSITQHEGQLWKNLSKARAQHANWLINTGPMPSGKINPVHVNAYRAIGKLIKSRGLPSQQGGEYEATQDELVAALAQKIVFKGFLKRLDGTREEKDAAGTILANYVFSLNLPPTCTVRRASYRAAAMSLCDEYPNKYKDGKVYPEVRKILETGDWNIVNDDQNGGLIKSIEKE